MGFNLDNYEDVHSRKTRFKAAFPSSRIITKVIEHDPVAGFVLIETSIYLAYEDEHPSAVDIAFGERDTYPASMRKFYVEDTSTSSQGRAYDLVLETTQKPTRQDMSKVEQPNKYEKKVAERIPVEKPSDPWTIEPKEMPVPVADAVTALNDGIVPEEIPMCPIHKKAMEPRTGNTRGKAWKHYKCNAYPDKCEQIIWMEVDKAGRWVPQRQRVNQGELN